MIKHINKNLIDAEYYLKVAEQLYSTNDCKPNFWRQVQVGFDKLAVLLLAQAYEMRKDKEPITLYNLVKKVKIYYEKYKKAIERTGNSIAKINKIQLQIDNDIKLLEKLKESYIGYERLIQERDKTLAHLDRKEAKKWQKENEKQRKDEIINNIAWSKSGFNNFYNNVIIKYWLEYFIKKENKKSSKEAEYLSKLSILFLFQEGITLRPLPDQSSEKEKEILIKIGRKICRRYSKFLSYELNQNCLFYEDYKNLLA